MGRSAYPTDLTDEQWLLISRRIPPAEPGGRDRAVAMRAVVDGILYLNRNGCTWRSLPHGFGPWGTVWYYFRRFRNDGTWQTIHDTRRDAVRKKAGKKTSPSAAIMDSQRVKTTEERAMAAGMTRARRCAGASGTSSSTRWG